jgi:hypothetical protein
MNGLRTDDAFGDSDVLLIVNGEVGSTQDQFQSYAIVEFDGIPLSENIFERTKTATLVLFKVISILERGATELTVSRLPESPLADLDLETLNARIVATDTDLEVEGPTFSVSPTPNVTKVEVDVTELVFELAGRDESKIFLKIANMGDFQVLGSGDEFYSKEFEDGKYAPQLKLGFVPTVSSEPTQAPTTSAAPSVSSEPTTLPTLSLAPSVSVNPSALPSSAPSTRPSLRPSLSAGPSSAPSVSVGPSASAQPSSAPSLSVAPSASAQPSGGPSGAPSGGPTVTA